MHTMIGLKKMFVTLTSAAKVGDRDQVPTPHLVPWCQDNMRPLQLTAMLSRVVMVCTIDITNHKPRLVRLTKRSIL